MVVAVALVLLIGGTPSLPIPQPAPLAVTSVPDEPDAVMLPEAATYQAVAADVNGDGDRDVVRLVGTSSEAIDVEAWSERGGRWERLGDGLNVVPGRLNETVGSFVYAGAPARLVARRVDGVERATLVRQPRFDEPGLEQTCCLLLHDVVVTDGVLELDEVAPRAQSADAVLAIDMDGDGTDELLVTRGLTPLGDTTFPTEGRVLRWLGDRFAEPVVTELSVGSGVSPYVLGDSDGAPGDEAAFIGAQSRLHRISLRDGDALVAESTDTGVLDALAVPIGTRRGIATEYGLRGLEVRPWPRDEPASAVVGASAINGDLVGVVAQDGVPQLAIRSATSTVVYAALPALDTITAPGERAAALGTSELRPYIGLLPGAGPRGEATLLAGGELVTESGRFAMTSALAGVVPTGLVGTGKRWLALWHGLGIPGHRDPTGGRLDAPTAQPGSGVSVVPFTAIFDQEVDDGFLDPPVDGAISDGLELVTGADGLEVQLEAPPGSRAYVRAGSEVGDDVASVPESGRLTVAIPPPEDAGPNPSYAARLTVVSPSGRAYVASWQVSSLGQAPTLEADAATSVGSAAVVIAGKTDRAAEVTIGGREVSADDDGSFRIEVDLPPWPTVLDVVATDRVGNQSRVAVIGIGWFDYRTLPWIVIALAGLAGAGVWIALRAPRPKERPVPDGDDAVLEELDPGDG